MTSRRSRPTALAFRHDGLWRTLLGIALALTGCGSPPPPAPEVTPTQGFILISIDTLRADRLGCYGYPRPTSPFLDELAGRGILFENAVVQLPGTLPSHMSIFTGLYPAEHGVYPPDGVLPDDVPTLPEMFRAAGFKTAGFTEGGYTDGSYGFARGFDRFDDEADGITADIEVTLERGLEFLRSLRPDERFFLFLHTYSVHDPYEVDDEYVERFWTRPIPDAVEPTGPNLTAINRGELDLSAEALEYYSALYDASIAYADDEFRGFFAALDDLALRDRATILVTSDHGEEFREHGQMVHEQVYPETLRVPLIVLHPEIPGPRRIQSLVQSIDIAPTLLELAGIEPPEVSGVSLLPLMTGDTEPTESLAYAEAFVQPVRSLWSRGDRGFHQLLFSSPSGRPGSNRATWISRSVELDTSAETVELEVSSHHRSRTLRVRVNGDIVDTLEIEPDRWAEIRLPLPEGSALNRIGLESDDCDIPAEVGESEDRRCLSFRVRGVALARFELYDLASDPQAAHDLSRDQADLVRWMTGKLAERQAEAPRTGQKRVLDPELVEKLKALGYLE